MKISIKKWQIAIEWCESSRRPGIFFEYFIVDWDWCVENWKIGRASIWYDGPHKIIWFGPFSISWSTYWTDDDWGEWWLWAYDRDFWDYYQRMKSK